MVYVLNQDGVAIMPTENHAKVRVLLKQGKAKVVRRTPFTSEIPPLQNPLGFKWGVVHYV